MTRAALAFVALVVGLSGLAVASLKAPETTRPLRAIAALDARVFGEAARLDVNLCLYAGAKVLWLPAAVPCPAELPQ